MCHLPRQLLLSRQNVSDKYQLRTAPPRYFVLGYHLGLTPPKYSLGGYQLRTSPPKYSSKQVRLKGVPFRYHEPPRKVFVSMSRLGIPHAPCMKKKKHAENLTPWVNRVAHTQELLLRSSTLFVCGKRLQKKK